MNATEPSKKPAGPGYPFGWPTPAHGKPKRKPTRRKGLTACACPAQNARALDASKAGPGNPCHSGRTSATHRALFVCPMYHYGGLGGAGFGLAGSLKPVFQTRPSRRHTALESGRVGSILHFRSQTMKTPTQATPKIRPKSTKAKAKAANLKKLRRMFSPRQLEKAYKESLAEEQAFTAQYLRDRKPRILSRDDLSFTRRDEVRGLSNWHVEKRPVSWDVGHAIGELYFQEIVELAGYDPEAAIIAISCGVMGMSEVCVGHGHESGFLAALAKWAVQGHAARKPKPAGVHMDMDTLEKLAVTDKPMAFELALKAIRQGDDSFIGEIIAEAVAFRETLAHLKAMRRARKGGKGHE